MKVIYAQLYEYLYDVLVDEDGVPARCCNDHRYTREFCRMRGLDVERVIAEVGRHGGCCCDCEVLLNATETLSWRKAMPVVSN